MPGGFNGTLKVIDIPASAGAFLAILATGPCRRIEVEESPVKADGTANTLIGLIQYQVPNDGFTQTFEAVGGNTVAAEGQVVPAAFDLGDDPGDHGPLGSMLGNGSGFIIGIGATNATTLCKVRSGGAATSVRVRQDY